MAPPQGVTLQLADYLNNGEYSDLQVRCGSITYKVHRLVLCSQIEFFRKACSAYWREGQECVVNLNHDNAYAVDALLRYAYSGKCDIFAESVASSRKALHYVQTYAIGAKYEVTGLQNLAKDYLRPLIEAHGGEEWLADVIRLVYETTISTDRGLRDIVVDFVVENHNIFAEQSDDDPIPTVMEELGAFSRDCFVRMSRGKKVANHALKTVEWKCGGCRMDWPVQTREYSTCNGCGFCGYPTV
ncbi:hypothetical protein BU16DRAFT_527918 [Lophium mytilinum]|uniref:BTB domain-containing protein n=1 Tax=Lophium mytilinum TaxID=390894 RepID=A0A6A6QNX7_9PEZI|nr:hypothetical protein BU16DRAFT_527918 [Lophium mytilinum]